MDVPHLNTTVSLGLQLERTLKWHLVSYCIVLQNFVKNSGKKYTLLGTRDAAGQSRYCPGESGTVGNPNLACQFGPANSFICFCPIRFSFYFYKNCAPSVHPLRPLPPLFLSPLLWPVFHLLLRPSALKSSHMV